MQESGCTMPFEITKIRTDLVCNTFVNDDYEGASQNNMEYLLQLDDCPLPLRIKSFAEEFRERDEVDEDGIDLR